MSYLASMPKTCSKEGCGKRVEARGLCNRHYQQAKRYGPLPPKNRNRAPLAERFEDCYTPEPFSGCWLWTECYNQEGYGQIVLWRPDIKRTTTEKAHRFSYRLHKGDIPKSMLVLHSCDTPMCVNPAHLRLGTDKDNKHDAIKRGRHAHMESHARAKLTREIVHKIRHDWDNGLKSQSQMARELGMQSATINAVVNHRIWRNI